MPPSGLSIARSALWNHLGKVADYALMYVVSVLIARGLGVDLYGRYTALISLLHVLLTASSFGLEASLTRHGAGLQGASVEERLRFLFRRGAMVRIGLFVIVAVLGGAVMLIGGWVQDDAATLLLLAGYAFTRAALPLFVAILTARFRTDRVAIISVIGRLCELAGIIIVMQAGLTLPVTLAVLCVAGVVQVVLHLVWNARSWWGTESPIPLAPVLMFGGVFWLNNFVDYFLGRQGDIALLALVGGDPAATSRYDVSYSLMQAGAMVATLGLSGVSLAALSRFGPADIAPRARLYESLVRINSLLTIPVLGFLFVAASDIIGIIYTGPFAGAAAVLRLLVGLRIVARICAGGENADLLLSLDRVRQLVLIGIVAAAVTVILHLVLIPRFSAEGAAVASGLGTLAANVLGVVAARQVVPLAIQWRSWITLTGLTLVAGGVTTFLMPVAATPALLLLKASVFMVSWYLPGLLIRPLEMPDAEALGRSLAILRAPMRPLCRGVEAP
jgi:O-antigen/teichoic acid export membrane protein